MKSPVTIYFVHHTSCKTAGMLSRSLYDWFRLGYLTGDQSGAGLPVYFRRQLDNDRLQPAIDFERADLNVVVLLVDHTLVADIHWRKACVELAKSVRRKRKNIGEGSRTVLLPVAMHESFYRMGDVYEGFNPIRLLDLTEEQMVPVLRRAVTEATARAFRSNGSDQPPPLDVFLSHAKHDGRQIAESIRDSVRSFGQMQAWYDANDLPHGGEWNSPMIQAAKNGTAAMIATVTDAYPTRPWCRREATLARSPRQLSARGDSAHIWNVQPVVAVHCPGNQWSKAIPMLEGVPRIGWDYLDPKNTTEQIVDRLALEVMLGLSHQKVAVELAKCDEQRKSTCYLTWVPDPWTLLKVRQQMEESPKGGSTDILRIVYPGYGLTVAEVSELQPAIKSFSQATQLISFEEAM